MIQLPHRSVTRFFIPLIDVMTLLFCIFLLMPLVKATGDGRDAELAAEPADPARPDDIVPPDWAKPEPSAIQAASEELQRLRTERIETLQQRLIIRVLEIDAETGKLYYHEPEQRVAIGSQADARRLVDRDKREAPGREIYYLFLFPRKLTGFPQEQQIAQYERWFEGIAHGFDNPRGGR